MSEKIARAECSLHSRVESAHTVAAKTKFWKRLDAIPCYKSFSALRWWDDDEPSICGLLMVNNSNCQEMPAHLASQRYFDNISLKIFRAGSKAVGKEKLVLDWDANDMIYSDRDAARSDGILDISCYDFGFRNKRSELRVSASSPRALHGTLPPNRPTHTASPINIQNILPTTLLTPRRRSRQGKENKTQFCLGIYNKYIYAYTQFNIR